MIGTKLGASAGFMLAVAMGCGQALAVSVDTLDGFTDADFNALISSGRYAEDAIAETRGGSNGVNGGATELNIQDVVPPGPGGTPAPQANFGFTSGVAYDFRVQLFPDGSLEYEFASGTAQELTLSSSGSVLDLPIDAINAIYVRTRGGIDGGIFEISDLALDGQPLGGSLFSDVNTPVDYLLIHDFSGAFTLTGKQTLTFLGAFPPEQSRLAQQIKIGSAAAVPLPPSVLLLMGGLGVLAMARRRA